jgi:outer membrane protein assembly factor BamB
MVSSVTPMVIGHEVETTERDDYLEKLTFAYSDRYGYSKFEHYKELLQRDYSDDDVFGSEELTIPVALSLAAMDDGLMDSPWPMKCHDVHHTGRSPYSTTNIHTEKWRLECDWVEVGIAIDRDGIIYLGGGFGGLRWYIHAIYANGTFKWMFKTGNLVWSTPAIAEDGTIYIGSYDTKLYAINPDGTEKWSFPSGGSISSSPAIAEDGTIYFGIMGPGNNGRIYALYPDGTEKWHYDSGYWIVSDPAIGDDGTIYIGSGDDYLYALYPNGNLRWRFKTGDIVKSHPSIAEDGTIYFDSFDGYLYALYPDGTERWKRHDGGSACSSACIDNDGTIYHGGYHRLNAIYPNGTLKWSFDLENRHISHGSPAISADGTIYFGVEIGDMEGGEIIAVNSDGTEKWRKKIAKWWVDSSPSIGEDGTVYIGSTYDIGGGYLHAFGPQETNDPPTAPSITGPLTGKAGTSYDYKFVASDPDRNPVSYYVEWGDSTNTGWTDDYNTGEEITLSHAWSSDGSFTIKAKARDTFGAEGPEASLTVTMPRSRTVHNTLFLKFLERFPLLERLLSFLF